MTPISDMVAEMLAKGIPADVIVLAVRTAEVGLVGRQSADHRVDESAERRRAYDRERQRKLREIRRQSADNPPTVTTPLTLPSSLSTSEENSKKQESKKVRARRSPKHPLSADFQPKDSHFAAAERLRIPRGAVFEKAEDMRLWAASSGEWKSDWDATLHGFLRRDADKLRNQNGKVTVLDAADQLIERIRQFDEPAPEEPRQLCSGAGAIAVRAVPEG